MTLGEKLIFLKNKGYTFNPENGDITSFSGKLIKGKSNGYIIVGTSYNGKQIHVLGHELGWYLYYNEIPSEIDHINRNRSDNKISNLRIVTSQQNKFNLSNTKGYYFNKRRNKYHASIQLNKKHIHIGYYNTSDEARNAYLEAKKKYHII